MSSLCAARILVVDDNQSVGSDLRLIFKGYRVEVAEGIGESLIESAKKLAWWLRPQVVIMDYRLFGDTFSDESGLELLRTKEFSSAQCVLYSAHLDEPLEIVRRARRDAQYVVGKNEPTDNLVEVVEEALREGCACCNRQGFRTKFLPSSWGTERVVRTIFGPDTEVPHDAVYDVLGRLFPENRELILRPLDGASDSSVSLPRGHSLVLKAFADDSGPYVIKLGLRSRIAAEFSAYRKHVEGRLGGTYAQLQSHVIFWDLGGIRYSDIGLPRRPITTFNAFYRKEKKAEVILKPLEHFFTEVWYPPYVRTRAKLGRNLFEAYDESLRLQRHLEEFPDRGEEKITFEGVELELPNPVRWVLNHREESEITSASQAVTHGDLHGDNLFAQGEFAWAIDFERTGEGPILRDFVELEHDIISRSAQFPPDDLGVFFEFVVALTAPESVDDSIELPQHLKGYDELVKASGVINGLRRMAREVTRYEDISEYYWGVLLDSLLSSSLVNKGSIQWQHSLLLGAVLSERLRRFGKEWPPPPWRSYSQSHPGSRGASESRALPVGAARRPYEYDAFLSYNSKDVADANRLAEIIKDAGVNVWMDKWNILPGDEWEIEIEQAMSSCRTYLALWGTSGAGPWHHDEMRRAIQRRLSDNLRVIPILLPGCQDLGLMPEVLRRIDMCDFREGLANEEEIGRLIRGIRKEF